MASKVLTAELRLGLSLGSHRLSRSDSTARQLVKTKQYLALLTITYNLEQDIFSLIMQKNVYFGESFLALVEELPVVGRLCQSCDSFGMFIKSFLEL
jgi:hypothetical protein